MSKIICDICGTTYPSSAEACPICGFSNQAGDELVDNDVNVADILEETRKSGLFSASSKKKEIFDYDEVNSDDEYADDDEDEDEEEDYEEAEENECCCTQKYDDQHCEENNNEGIMCRGFFLFSFFLPNMGDKSVPVEPTSAVIEETEVPSTEATVPCQQMVSFYEYGALSFDKS